MSSNTFELSGIKPRIVHGIEIRKMPLRAYMQFAAKGSALIPVILDELFPGMSTPQIITRAMALDRDGIMSMLAHVLVQAPQVACEALAELVGVEVEQLINNPQIGPSELWDIIEAWNEVNDLKGFFGRVSKQFRRP